MIRKILYLAASIICLMVLIVGLEMDAGHNERSKTSVACRSNAFHHERAPAAAAAAAELESALNRCFASQLNPPRPLSAHSDPIKIWPMSQVIDADLATAQLPGEASRSAARSRLEAQLQLLNRFWDYQSDPPGYTPKMGASGFKWYDDNDWVALDLVAAYKLIGDGSLLKRANQIFQLEEIGASKTQKFSKPGGVLWTQIPWNHYRSTVSTAGAAQLALVLYLINHQSHYLHFAEKMVAWVNANLRFADGLYGDGIEPDGWVWWVHFSYNDGLMLGDNTLLYMATGKRAYLTEAERIAKEAIDYYGSDNRYWNNPQAHQVSFNGVLFQNLMRLDSVVPLPACRAALNKYAAQIWQYVNPATGVFFQGGKPDIQNQAVAVLIYSYVAMDRTGGHERSQPRRVGRRTSSPIEESPRQKRNDH